MGEDPIRFMNYGYAPAGDADRINLSTSDEDDRAHIQLYHSVAGAIDLRDLRVMEMSCGRGGGASYVSRYLKPRLVVGVDRTQGALQFARRHHGNGPLGFVCGDAMSFPFGASSFDAVVSVEASHCYPDFAGFLVEVRRVLRPGGLFLYTDFRDADECDAWHEQIAASGLPVQQEEDITGHVVRGLELNEKRTQALIR
ncbi:MAG: class I SAM-dependent methyltransferase, partial [Planctomycetes bacterium]|nr:class I SAM-dependent methyltransferase [Planctomycetota bacterium]